MQMNQIYLATTEFLQFIMNGTECKIIWILDINKHIKVTILILLATRNRTKDADSLDAMSQAIFCLVLFQLLYVVRCTIHFEGKSTNFL